MKPKIQSAYANNCELNFLFGKIRNKQMFLHLPVKLLDYDTRRVQGKQLELKLNGKQQLLVCMVMLIDWTKM